MYYVQARAVMRNRICGNDSNDGIMRPVVVEDGMRGADIGDPSRDMSWPTPSWYLITRLMLVLRTMYG